MNTQKPLRRKRCIRQRIHGLERAAIAMVALTVALSQLAGVAAWGQVVSTDPATGSVTTYEAEGNLESNYDLGCIEAAELRDVYSPMDLLRAAGQCAAAGRLEQGAFLYIIASVYNHYDTLRVADETAHQAFGMASLNLRTSLGDELMDAMAGALQRMIEESGEFVAAVCDAVLPLGPPAYHPTYMIQHGLDAMVPWGQEGTEDGLVPDFDGAAAWRRTVHDYSNCPEAGGTYAAEPPPPAVSVAELQAAFDRIAEQEEALDELRAQLAAAQSPAEIERLEARNAQLTEQFTQELVDFLNVSQISPGAPRTAMEAEVLRRKSYEDMLNAEDWIYKGGDYATAISILESAAAWDPEFEELQGMLAWAIANRYMSEERLQAVELGMTEDQVRGAIGQVLLANVREFPDRGVVAWFYPTSEDGTAAAVWFRQNSAGQLAVYQTNFDAVP